MATIEYRASLDLFVHHTDDRVEHFNYNVDNFEVDGGAVRKISLGSASEPLINNELEQARTHKNLIFYLKSNNRHSTSKIIDLFKSGVKIFNAYFYIKGYEKAQKQPSRVKNLIAKSSFLEAPIPIGATPPSLKVKLSLNQIEFYQGGYNEKGDLEFN